MIIGLPVTIVAQAGPASAPAASPTVMPPVTPSPADVAVTTRAKDWLHQIQAGKVDRSQLDAKMNAALTDSTLAQVSSQLQPLGDPTAFTLVQRTTRENFAVYVFKVEFTSVTLYETFALDPDGKIAGLFIGKQ